MRTIKNRTYNNFMRIMRLIISKGYTRQTAEEITHRIFDEYEANPAGLPILSKVAQIVPADHENGEHRKEPEPVEIKKTETHCFFGARFADNRPIYYTATGAAFQE